MGGYVNRLRLRLSDSHRDLKAAFEDIDHFKSINDTLGHAAGDALLRELSKLANAGLRALDVAGRWGGEEFLLVLPGTFGVGEYARGEEISALLARADGALYAGKARGRNQVVLG